jgi:LysM repeat protein/GH24 family phage-related lysozyme (muramidase)
MASYNTSGVTSYTDTSSIAGISAASGQDYSSGSSGLMSASSSRGRNRDADMYAGSKYAPTKNAGTAKAKQSFAATATSSDDDNGYTPTAIAAKFEAAGATLPPARNPMDRFRDTMASSLYDSDMFKPYVPDPTEEIETYLGNTAVEDALKEALGIDDTQRQTYQGIPTAEEPEPNIDMSVLQAALMPEPITVEELPDVTVKAGDTLSAIAAENNLPVQDVIDANPQIANPDMIRPGEVVSLPAAQAEIGQARASIMPAQQEIGQARAAIIMKGIDKLFGLFPPKTDVEKQAKTELEYFLDAQPESSLPDFFKYVPDKVQIAEYMKGRAERKKAAGTMNFTGGDVDTSNLQYVDVEGTTAAADKVDFDFIKEREGYKKSMYVPKDGKGNVLGKSGATIASGFDLGQRNESDLEGLSSEIVTKLKPYLGKKGAAANTYVESNPLTLTTAEVDEVNKFAKKQELDRLEEKWDSSSSSTKFKDLTKQQATVVASVAFQYGDLSKKAPTFWKHVTAGDWTAAEEELRDFGDKYPTRRGYEADYLVSN